MLKNASTDRHICLSSSDNVLFLWLLLRQQGRDIIINVMTKNSAYTLTSPEETTHTILTLPQSAVPHRLPSSTLANRKRTETPQRLTIHSNKLLHPSIMPASP